MGVTDFFAGEIVTELLKQLFRISRKSWMYKNTAENLLKSIKQLLPIIQEIKLSGVELSEFRQSQLDRFSELLREGLDLSNRGLASGRWNVYENLRLSRKLEKLERNVNRFFAGPLQAQILADVHHLRFDTDERLNRLDRSHGRIEERLESLRIGAGVGGGWVMEEVMRRAEEEEEMMSLEGSLVTVGLELGKKKVKELLIGREDLSVVEISGIGGSGKTTLARELCKDQDVRSHFSGRILFRTVSQSPNVDRLRSTIWQFVMGTDGMNPSYVVPEFNLQHAWKHSVRTLIVLDDVWSQSELERLVMKLPGCKTLVVSRFNFPSTVVNATHEMALLREDEALALFCLSAFGKKSVPPMANTSLVKQIVNECKGLPLALKVIGASLRDQSEMFWASARKRLARSEPICESHESHLLERMAISVNCLTDKVKECFLDLGAFPEDKKIPLDVLISMWVHLHGIDAEEAFAVLHELANKNLLTLVKDARYGDSYCGYYDVAVTQHDVLRDLALHLSCRGRVNERKRLLMARRDSGLPKEWENNADQPFNARIVSIHTGEMTDMDWFPMQYPQAKVVIINFSSENFLLPPFLEAMPKLKAVVMMNYHSVNAVVRNFPDFSTLESLQSLWLEKVTVPKLSSSPFPNLRKLSLVLCKINDTFDDPKNLELALTFPSLTELTIDHCDDLFELPPSVGKMNRLKILSLTNCHNLQNLPTELGRARSLQILRLYACPELSELPVSLCELHGLKYLDVSQCVRLTRLPLGFERLESLEKIDMRDCARITALPRVGESLRCLRQVVCDDDVSWLWEDAKRVLPNLHVQVAEKFYSLDWLDE